MKLILLGAGHAHLLLTERLDRLRRSGLRPLLIAPRWFDYSGLATAVLSGDLPPGSNRIDIAALARGRGLDFIEGVAVAIDRPARSLVLADGSRHDYDLLSLNIGSIVGGDGGDAAGWPVKPLAGLGELRETIERSDAFPSVRIIGAGASGTEVAAALLGLAERLGRSARIALVGSSDYPAPGWARLHSSLEKRGLILSAEDPPGHWDVTIRATGLVAPDLVRSSGLAVRASGAAVAPTLRSTVDPAIFAVGDCADFGPGGLPMHGVFGVRQAPVLARNLAALASGRPLSPYRPQRRWLAILDLGDGTGFATWGRFWWRSGAMLALKRFLDRRFVDRFRRIYDG